MPSYPESPRADQSSADEMSAPGGADKDHSAASIDPEGIWRWAVKEAIGYMDLTLGARETWRILHGYTGKCYPTHWTIAERLRRSASAVCRYLRELTDKGYIMIEARYDDGTTRRPGQLHRKPRGQTSNLYTILKQPDLTARAQQIVQEWHAKRQRKQSGAPAGA